MKRVFDFVVAVVTATLLLPILLLLGILIFLQDWHTPLYVGTRVGWQGKPFGILKFRSMRTVSNMASVMSTAGHDPRITRVGRFLRAHKLDELPQLFNIIRGDMSFVGPRPNVFSEVRLYSKEEGELLSVRPGITDLASIVFSDEGEILRGSKDSDRDYNLLIRPWKSRLGLHYVRVRTFWLDLQILALTAVALASKPTALRLVRRILIRTRGDAGLIEVCERQEPLAPALPPGVTYETWQLHLAQPQSAD